MLQQAIIAAIIAGNEILDVYNTNFDVEYKQDKSPLTLADKRASDIIISELQQFNIPVLSEEGVHESFNIRKHWKQLWIVDPLDGTKEFVKRNGEFTVNIALVEDNVPTLGVIYSPVFKILYFSQKNLGAFKVSADELGILLSMSLKQRQQYKSITLEQLFLVAKKLPILTPKKNYVVVASRSHMSSETFQHIEALKLKHTSVEIINTGSSIKMCLVAEGVADEYPRYGATMEWDTAAGQAILQESGGCIIDYKTNKPMLYNREELLNNHFIAKRK